MKQNCQSVSTPLPPCYSSVQEEAVLMAESFAIIFWLLTIIPFIGILFAGCLHTSGTSIKDKLDW